MTNTIKHTKNILTNIYDGTPNTKKELISFTLRTRPSPSLPLRKGGKKISKTEVRAPETTAATWLPKMSTRILQIFTYLNT